MGAYICLSFIYIMNKEVHFTMYGIFDLTTHTEKLWDKVIKNMTTIAIIQPSRR